MPTDELLDQLRDQDLAVLSCLKNGEIDVQQIKAATILNKRQVNYALEKLENLQLIEVHRPEGQVERIIDGQKRVFDAPKEAKLTEAGIQCIRKADSDGEQYKQFSQEELVNKIHQLENRIETIEGDFENLRKQVIQKLRY